jgi:prepilin-type N-terminal cleavage/methylation domain-containing protein
MKQGRGCCQCGFSLLEVLVAVALLLVLFTAAVPSMLSFYRQYAVEYETEHLLADIRKAQSISRTAAPDAREYGARSQEEGASLRIDRNSYLAQVGYDADAVRIRHHYLPLVHVVKKGQVSGEWFISFTDNGGLKSGDSMMTLQIFCEGQMAEARQIMISRGGRIRIERGDS